MSKFIIFDDVNHKKRAVREDDIIEVLVDTTKGYNENLAEIRVVYKNGDTARLITNTHIYEILDQLK